MSNNDEVLKTLVKVATENGQLLAQLDSLHRAVDAADIKGADYGYGGETVSTEFIRNLFGWKLCDGAKNARIEREARIAKIREEMEREDARMDE